jgi:hypothetical protein
MFRKKKVWNCVVSAFFKAQTAICLGIHRGKQQKISVKIACNEEDSRARFLRDINLVLCDHTDLINEEGLNSRPYVREATKAIWLNIIPIVLCLQHSSSPT